MLNGLGTQFAKRRMSCSPAGRPQNRAFIYAKTFRVCRSTVLEFR
jgi:hypothetical protein